MNPTASPTFSVLMPVYNREKYVAEAIDSVLAQTYTRWELLICDDGSTDRSYEIISGYAARDPRIKVMRQANAGPSAARKALRPLAIGQWIAQLDSDDLYFPDALQSLFDYLTAHPEATFAYGYRYQLLPGGEIIRPHPEYQDRVTTAVDLFQRMYISSLCVAYRIELMDKAGGYDERLRGSEDYDLYLRMSPFTKFYPIGKALGLHRRHDSNISAQTGFNRSNEAAVLERFINRYGGRELLGEKLINRRLGKIYYAAGRQYFRQRCFAQAIAVLRKAVRFKPTLNGLALLALSHGLLIFGREDAERVPEL